MKHALAVLACCAVGMCAAVQPAPARPHVHVTAQDVAQVRKLMGSLADSMGRQQAELETGIREAAARAGWSDNDRARFMRTVFQSKTQRDFEKEAASLTAELRSMQEAVQRDQVKGAEANCRFVERMLALLTRLQAVNALQSADLARQLRAVKPAR